MGAVILSCLRAVFLVYASARGARRLYEQMFVALIHAPIGFFDTTPTGRILNRIAQDTQYIDERLMGLFQDSLDHLMSVISVVGVIVSVAPWFLVLLVPLSIAFFFLQRAYRSTSREIKRLDSVTRSPIFTNFEETVHGLPVIRAAGFQNDWIKRNDGFIDKNFPWFFSVFTAQKWIGMRLEAIGVRVNPS